jgi:hypothetical protein
VLTGWLSRPWYACVCACSSCSVDVVFSENAIICNVDSKDPKKPPELHFQILKDSNYSVANVEISANLW